MEGNGNPAKDDHAIVASDDYDTEYMMRKLLSWLKVNFEKKILVISERAEDF